MEEWAERQTGLAAGLDESCQRLQEPAGVLDTARLGDRYMGAWAAWVRLYLGAALYRAGEYEEARQPLLGSAELAGQMSSHELFYLAMIAARQGDPAQARAHHDDAVAWMDEHEPNNPVLIPLRRESALLLGIEDGRPSD